MKPLKFGLRIWFTLTSLVSFLVGWMLLSHAGKPTPLIAPDTSSTDSSSAVSVSNPLPTPLPTLQPLPSLNSLTSGSSTLQSLPSTSSSLPQRSTPRLRGRGS